jgi:hypothetical protein
MLRAIRYILLHRDYSINLTNFARKSHIQLWKRPIVEEEKRIRGSVEEANNRGRERYPWISGRG